MIKKLDYLNDLIVKTDRNLINIKSDEKFKETWEGEAVLKYYNDISEALKDYSKLISILKEVAND
jgi:hypothetical protein